MTMPKFSNVRKTASAYLVGPVITFLATVRITPYALTWCGFALTVVAGLLILEGYMLYAGIMVLVAGYFDMLDGALARRTNQVTKFGGVLDSTLDRLAEAVLMICIIVAFAREPSLFGILLTVVALVGSLMVSYLRSRIEAADMECKEVGIFTRSERVIVLALGLLLARLPYALITALAIIAAFSLYTAGERLWYAWKQTKGR